MFLVILIYVCCAAGLLWAIINAREVTSIELSASNPTKESDVKCIDMMLKIGNKIENGAGAFLSQEYSIMSIFTVLFAVVVFVLVDYLGASEQKRGISFYATIAFLVGSITSMICGYIGMKIAVKSNFRTTYKAIDSLSEAFKTAFRAGCVMGFSMISISLLILITIFELYKKSFDPVTEPSKNNSWAYLTELLAAYGLGGSCIALFGRVGGGIYTKAADVGADLVGKVEEGLEEDSPRNPATIADNVGDNVGDIAGMGADLFGSFAESTCAALVFVATNYELVNPHESKALYFPMLISAFGIVACILSSAFGIYGYEVGSFELVEKALKLQLMISTFLILLTVPVAALLSLPEKWENKPASADGKTPAVYATRTYACISVCMGLISGLIIGYSTDYYTSNAHAPVQEMSAACSSGPAINIIYGLALGYNSTIVPVILLALTAVVSIKLCGLFGVALAAIGMLSNLCVGLAIDAYGPISDNAGGIAEMSGLGEDVRKKTDALDAAGNTTAAIGKGFAIGSAALVSLALYSAFVTRSKTTKENSIKTVEITDPYIFGSLLIGAMLPYAFSAMTMKSVGSAAREMVNEVRRQFRDPRVKSGEVEPDYESCIRVSTAASLKEMIAPGLLVILTPIAFGVLLHPTLVAGLLPGALISGVQLAISMSNTGGAWDNAKKYIESGKMVGEDGMIKGKGTDEHKAAVIGDTVGDPLKDTSGPSLNILVKLMAIISLVFAGAFSRTAYLGKTLGVE